VTCKREGGETTSGKNYGWGNMRKIEIRSREQKQIAKIENHEEKDRRDPNNEKLDSPPLLVLSGAQRPFEIGEDQGKDNQKENRNPVTDIFEGLFVVMETGVEKYTYTNKR
jgi:hypothetical protein